MKTFEFKDYPLLTDGEIEVVIKEKRPVDKKKGYVPAYEFAICLPGNPEAFGRVGLRISNSTAIKMYPGQIGYSINEGHRGHNYAAKACKLIKPVALDHGLKTLWITCNPNNTASRKTCEALGCEFVEIVDIPADHEMYQKGERQVCRYRWEIG